MSTVGIIPPGDDPALTELIRLQAKVEELERKVDQLEEDKGYLRTEIGNLSTMIAKQAQP